MTLSSAKGKQPLIMLLGLMVASLAILLLLPPIPQDPSYHQFADQRTLLGIPNFWNVVSNLPFVVVGAMGLWQFGRDRARFVLFLGIFLTGFGSAYYHWNPNNDTLFWDRLPMALAFMAILTVAVEEHVSAKTGAILLWPLVALAVFSLLLWRWTDDLRLYAWVQFFPTATDNLGAVNTTLRSTAAATTLYIPFMEGDAQRYTGIAVANRDTVSATVT